MAASPARKVAFETLRRVEAECAYASDELHDTLVPSVKRANAALATELTLGVLRWRRLLDCLLEGHLKKPIDRLDLPVAVALRMGLYQLRFLDKIPARAAVNDSVELVKRARKSSAAALVNAVLRKATLEASISADKLLPPNLSPIDRLGIGHSHPSWMVERWLSRLGEAQTIALLEANNQRSRLSCALHQPHRREEVFAELEAAGMRVEPGLLLRNAFAVSGGSVTNMPAFRAGLISVQDESSQAVPLLLDVRSGDCVLDLCAAPGGKTLPLARAAGSSGMVIAADRYTHRLKAMRAQFERLRLGGAHLVELDAEQPLPFGRKFDRILVDAPCSGTGTLARHPEIRWRLKPEQLAELHRLQVHMLQNALACLVRGGRLVYSTCSMEPEENEDVVGETVGNEPSIQRVAASAAAKAVQPRLVNGLDAEKLFGSSGYFRTSPAVHRTDGFFAAILERV